jgi:hypothetical protein
MKRAFAIAAVAELVFVLLLLRSAIKDFLWTHPWWHSFLIAVPTIALPILAYFELRHSGEANRLRIEANDLRAEANALQGQIVNLTAELDAERNKHLQQIARNTEKPVTQAERNADILRKHQRANVTVSEGQGAWPNTPEIVEVGDDNMVTLFTPHSYSSPAAWCVKVRCDELEISEIPQGSCPLRLKVLKRYGPNVQLGKITKWEDRLQPAAAPTFAKGGVAYHATYGKPGSAERRALHVFASSDGANSFLLEASTREKVIGDNVEISKRFMVMQIEYEAAGFGRSGSGTGGSPHPLFVR